MRPLVGAGRPLVPGGPASTQQPRAVDAPAAGVVPRIRDALLPRGPDGQPLALPWGQVEAPTGTENLHPTTRSNGLVWGKNALGRFVLQVPAPSAAVSKIAE